MSNGRSLLALLAILSACSMTTTAKAQFGGDRIQRPFQRPTVSPYINLFGGGNRAGGNAVRNYYGVVRPQQQFYSNGRQFSNQLQTIQQRQQTQPTFYSHWSQRYGGDQSQNEGQANGLQQFRRFRMNATGHQTGFMTLSGPGAGGQGQGNGAGGGNAGFGGGNGFSGNNGPSFSGHGAGFGTGSYGNNSRF